MKNLIKIILLTSLLLSTKAFAFGTFLNSSTLLHGNEYDVSGAGQFFSGDRRGTHLIGMIDLPMAQTTNLRFQVGVASLDFSLGASLKWVPVKENSESLLNFGLVLSSEYGRDGGNDALLFRASPFLSKAFSWEYGAFEPYVALPFGALVFDSESRITSQFIAGSKVKVDSLNYMSFSFEGGFDIKNSASHFALMATIFLRK